MIDASRVYFFICQPYGMMCKNRLMAVLLFRIPIQFIIRTVIDL